MRPRGNLHRSCFENVSVPFLTSSAPAVTCPMLRYQKCSTKKHHDRERTQVFVVLLIVLFKSMPADAESEVAWASMVDATSSSSTEILVKVLAVRQRSNSPSALVHPAELSETGCTIFGCTSVLRERFFPHFTLFASVSGTF